jgi:hypothetical protein
VLRAEAFHAAFASFGIHQSSVFVHDANQTSGS